MIGYSVLLVIISAVSLGSAVYIYRAHSEASDVSRLFGSLLLVASALWMFGEAFEINSTGYQAKVFWDAFQYLGIVFIPTYWFIFLAEYSGHGHFLSRRNLLALQLVPVISLVLVFTNAQHLLMWDEIALIDPYFELEKTYGFWYWVFMTYSVSLVTLGVMQLIGVLRRSAFIQMRQVWAILLGSAMPLTASLLDAADIALVPNFDLTSISYTVSALIITWTVSFFRKGDLLLVSRDRILMEITDGVIVVDERLQIADANPAACKILSEPEGKIIGEKLDRYWPGLKPLLTSTHLPKPEDRAVTLEVARAGQIFDLSVTTIADWQNRPLGQILVLRDITLRKEMEVSLIESEEKFRTLADESPNIVFINQRGRIVYTNNRAVERLGYQKFEFYDTEFEILSLIDPAKHILVQRIFEQHDVAREAAPQEIILRTREGERIDAIVNTRLIHYSGNQAVLAIITDITERKRTEERMAYLATHDALTGLPNRLAMDDRLKLALAHARRKKEMFGIFLLDLDNLKAVNDTYGHDMGDSVLVQAGERLAGLLRESDTVARIGGDEFMVLLPDVVGETGVIGIAEKVLTAFQEPFQIGDHKIICTQSFGIAIYPEDGADLLTLRKNADVALYCAKEQGRNQFARYKRGQISSMTNLN